MSLSLTQSAVNLIESAGYAGLGLGLVVDSAGIPIPSEVLIPLAVVSALQGKMDLVTVMVIATLAQIAGGVVAYEVGRRGGLPFIHAYGKYFFVSQKELNYTHRQFEKYGDWLAMIGRCVPVIRGYIGFVAGIAEMPRRRFLLATSAGSLLWTLILSAAGYWLEKDITVIDRTLRPVSYAIIAAAIILVAWFVIRHYREYRQKT